MDNKAINCAGIIIENSKGEILLQLRDEKVKDFPNHWVLLGGGLENGESPEQTAKREIKEETGIELGNLKHFKNFSYRQFNQAFFYKKMDLDPSEIVLKEGKEIRFFSKKDITGLKFGFNIREVVESFLSDSKWMKREK